MIIISWNVNGLRAIIKKGFIDTITSLNPDILCLQEVKASKSEVLKALTPLRIYGIHMNPALRKGYSGTVLLCKIAPSKIEKAMGIEEHDTEGRIICATYEDFYLVNVYVPNSGQQLNRLEYRKKWDQDFLEYLNDLKKKKPILVIGDFNVAHQPIDLKNDKANYNKTAGYTQVEIDGMDNLLATGLVDTFRHFHPNEIAYTYWTYRFKARENNIGWRIDYFLVSDTLLPKISAAEILSDIYGSDHCPIKLTINL
ncbi:exodeoxyribonuclease-3 [Gillisia mitskevichiae]|uniref:Exodeoxyribonuclease-3 n=1 Tax=Gillisia mitskevichiae TaxID=270921 RepID=A0A495PVD1_9FLAO|nr:exodeoxyribonuclease III [Gillisia mitskevichiae]RKS53725.1 exodeoxyribonuclease-3 [Gillisia mitskevichiae]